MENRRLLIAGSRSGVGKTTISLGIMRAFKNRGLNVQPFKVGPDYIDPGFHTLISEKASYNLDSYFLGSSGVKKLFLQKSEAADISIIEGVMGLFDGRAKDAGSSSAEIAKTLKTPVVLVIDAAKMAQSAAALVYGYKNYDPDLNLKGVIINNISSSRHYKLLKQALESERVGVEVLGYLPRNLELELPERHLGLVPVGESSGVIEYADKLSELIEQQIDLERLEDLALSAGVLREDQTQPDNSSAEITADFSKKFASRKVKIGVARDQAFNFYYQSNLDLLQEAGAEIIYFSPIADLSLPDADFIYFGGGFPESFLEELSTNESFKEDLLLKVEKGLPVYGECGGLMYLSRSIKNFDGRNYDMCSLIPLEVEMTEKLQEMGYREIEALRDNILLKKGEKARGHVFHYSKLSGSSKKVKLNYRFKDSRGAYSTADNVLASYLHLHFASNPNLIKNILESALRYQKSREG